MSKLCDYQFEDMDTTWGNADPTQGFYASYPMWTGYTILLVAAQHINTPRDRIIIGSRSGQLYYAIAKYEELYYNTNKLPIKVTYEELKKLIEGRINAKQGVLYYHKERVKEFLNELSTKQGTKDAVPERSNGVVT